MEELKLLSPPPKIPAVQAPTDWGGHFAYTTLTTVLTLLNCRICVRRFKVTAAGGFHSVLSQPQLITAFLNNSFHNDKEKRAGYNFERFTLFPP